MKMKGRSNFILVCVFCLLLVTFFTAFLVTPKVRFSEREKKVLSTMPDFTLTSLTDGSYFSGIDTFVSDHFPLREMWVGAAAYGSLITGRNGANGVYQGEDGYLIHTPFAWNTAQLKKNQKFLQDFCQASAAKIYYMPVPSAGYLLEDKLPDNHAAYEDDKVYEALALALGSQAELVDLRQPLKAPGETQVFYKTDHHWTTGGAYMAYQAFLKQAMPGDSAPLAEYQKESIKGFYGTAYAKSGLWLNRPDTIELWKNPVLAGVTVEITDDDVGSSVTKQSVFEHSYVDEADKFPVFLGGNHSLVKISNPNASTDQKILLVKDSFANVFAPFLAEQYSTVYLVDLRYSRQRSVSALVEENGIGTVLFLYSTDDLVNDNNFMWLK